MSIRKGSLITMLLSFIAATSVVAGNDTMKKTTETATGKFEKATFAGGCFWCMEAPFDLLDVFWRNTDPTVADRQFCDVGSQYRTGIFYHSEEQRLLALKSKEALEKSKPFKGPIVTEVTKAGEFYPAEEYHQHYYKKNPIRYRYYRNGCGRDQRLKELWGDAAGH